jgi:alanyl-tRNA synthetase
MMTGTQIRDAFLRFFAERGHKVMQSSLIIPEDPTTLFTTAGMQQFVPWFRREIEPPYGSVATVQKCARTDDLDQVGRTARHHTFFEMLGNFSFGDYFKKETLKWGWEFSTFSPEENGLGLDPDKIWVTYYQPKEGEPYQEDLDARAIWLEIGVPLERIIPLGKKENWWGPVGDSGPCGPCSEMHYDRGEHLKCGPECVSPACGCDRWIEFWNHVFQQFNYQDGKYTPLPVPGIDTGAGLERIASLVQDVESNFDTDLLIPIINKTKELAGIDKDAENGMALRVIADHLRCCAFMIADGVLPSNNKRGYVVRRIIRRAYRFGRNIGFTAPFLYKLVPVLSEMMGFHYTSLQDNAKFIADTLRVEEQRFAETLERGEEMLATLIEQAKSADVSILKGSDVFTLYDTYGFPKELTIETALESNLTIDEEGFAKAFASAREIARSGNKFNYAASSSIGTEIPVTEFIGYTSTSVNAKILSFNLHADGRSATIVLDTTPFYATSGGQEADTGEITIIGESYLVTDVQKDKYGHFIHNIVSDDEIPVYPLNTGVSAHVLTSRRNGIRRSHTATHLLHWALQNILGEHARQAGSLVDDDVLRFDFNHPQALTKLEITEIEDAVNEHIMQNSSVAIKEMNLDEARKSGYTALFGEKYGDWVRTVNIGDHNTIFSKELCGGIHAESTGNIGLFIITTETSVAAGIRRIEAVTGEKAREYNRNQAEILKEICFNLKSTPIEVAKRIEQLQKEIRDAGLQIAELKVKAAAGGGTAGPDILEINGVKAIISVIEGVDSATLATITDQYMEKIITGIVALAGISNDKLFFAVKVSKELTGKYNAGNIVREMAKATGGGGGGRADFAQAGGKDIGKLNDAIEIAKKMI